MAEDIEVTEGTEVTETTEAVDSGIQTTVDNSWQVEQTPDALEQESVPAETQGPDQVMIDRANGYGLTAEDIEGFDSAKLDKMFSGIDRRLMQPQQQQQPQPQQRATPQPVMPTAYEPLKLEFGEDIDESLSGPFKGFMEQMNGQFENMHKFRQEVTREFENRDMKRDFNQFDTYVNGLGDEWGSVYGKGNTLDMDPNSAEFKKRIEVFAGAQSLSRDAISRAQRLSTNDSWTRSHHAVNWDKVAEMERAKIGGKVEARQRSFGERPSKGKTPAMSPRDQALEAWNRKN